MRTFLLFVFMALAGMAQAFPDNPFGKTDFLPVDKAFEFSSEQLPSGETQLHWQIADGYYLYKQRLKFGSTADGGQPVLPEGETHHDDFFGTQQVYRHTLDITLPASTTRTADIGWQGCADAGLCYPPQSAMLKAGNNASPTLQADDQSLANGLLDHSLGWSLLIFLGLGLLLAFTPCSLPMLPILAALVVGSKAGPKRSFALALAYVLSMALVYAGLGVLAALLGGNLQATLQQPWVIGGLGGLFVLLALPMFGLFELQLPTFLRDRLENAGRARRGGSVPGAAALGALSGLLIGPCMTAPLAGALLYIAQSGDAVRGGLVLFTMGLGMGAPLLLLVTVGARFLPRPGSWMDLLKGLFGFLFLGTALFVLMPLLNETLWVGLTGALLAAFAYSAWSKTRKSAVAAWSAPGALVLGVWGSLMLVGAAGGSTEPLRPLSVFTATATTGALPAHEAFSTLNEPAALQRELDAAKAGRQWVLIDYYADWCVACKIMDKEVFAKPDVLAALEGVRLLRPDVTRSSPASRQLLERYQVPGPPSLLWIGPDGEERRSRRITGGLNAEAFMQQWQMTREQG